MALVLSVGMAVMDFVLEVAQFPTRADKYRARSAMPVGGGCAANGAFAVARLGGQSRLAARLGDDLVGRMILADLADTGVDVTDCQQTPGARSSFSSVLVDEAGERQIVNYRGEGLTQATDWITGPADAVLADTRWINGARAAMALARRLGVPGIIDAEAPSDPDLLAMASHVAFSRPGLADFTGSDDIAEGLARAAARLPGHVCVTDGAAGAYLARDARAPLHVPATKVAVVDTLAAGDIWHGAYALRLAEGADEVAAAGFANAAAALKCTAFGGRAGCPDRQAVEVFIRENNPCN